MNAASKLMTWVISDILRSHELVADNELNHIQSILQKEDSMANSK